MGAAPTLGALLCVQELLSGQSPLRGTPRADVRSHSARTSTADPWEQGPFPGAPRALCTPLTSASAPGAIPGEAKAEQGKDTWLWHGDTGAWGWHPLQTAAAPTWHRSWLGQGWKYRACPGQGEGATQQGRDRQGLWGCPEQLIQREDGDGQRWAGGTALGEQRVGWGLPLHPLAGAQLKGGAEDRIPERRPPSPRPSPAAPGADVPAEPGHKELKLLRQTVNSQRVSHMQPNNSLTFSILHEKDKGVKIFP